MLNNPAGRLHALLSAAVKISPNSRARDAWKQLLRVDGKELAPLLERLGPVFMLPNQAKSAVLQLPNENHNVLLEWTAGVDRAFASVVNLHTKWEPFTAPLDRHTLYSLKVAADRISRCAHEPELSDDALKRVAEEVEDLREEVVRADIAVELKETLLKHLREIQYAVDSYRVEGAPGISRAANNAIGSIIFAPHRTPNEKSIRQKFVERVAGIAVWAQFGVNIAKIVGASVDVTQWFLDAPTVAVEQAPTKLLPGEVAPEEDPT